MIIDLPNIIIYFGNAADQIYKEIDCAPRSQPLIYDTKYAAIAKKLKIDHIALLHQTHSAQGIIVNREDIPSFNSDGDFLVTTTAGIGLSVLTADCLPVIIYDEASKKIAVVHAGWRGSAQKILLKALAHFENRNVRSLQFFFGPSAQPCCYKVDENFKNSFAYDLNALRAFVKKDEAFYFDLPLFNKLQMMHAGIDPSAIVTDYNVCTICNQDYFSYRKQKEKAGRQITVVALK